MPRKLSSKAILSSIVCCALTLGLSSCGDVSVNDDIRVVQAVQENVDVEATPETVAQDRIFFDYCGVGGQYLIDTCLGVTRFSDYESYGFSPTYVIHWEHGGYNLPLNDGIVTINGVGDFRIHGVVSTLNYHVHTTDNLPYGAAPIFFQTCLNGDNQTMVFLAATPL